MSTSSQNNLKCCYSGEEKKRRNLKYILLVPNQGGSILQLFQTFLLLLVVLKHWCCDKFWNAGWKRMEKLFTGKPIQSKSLSVYSSKTEKHHQHCNFYCVCYTQSNIMLFPHPNWKVHKYFSPGV